MFIYLAEGFKEGIKVIDHILKAVRIRIAAFHNIKNNIDPFKEIFLRLKFIRQFFFKRNRASMYGVKIDIGRIDPELGVLFNDFPCLGAP